MVQLALKRLGLLSLILISTAAIPSSRAEPTPDCTSGNGKIGVINEQVLEWRRTTPNQFKARAYISGKLTKILEDTGDHPLAAPGPEARDRHAARAGIHGDGRRALRADAGRDEAQNRSAPKR